MNTQAIQRLIYTITSHLDAESYKAFLTLCTDDFHYSVVTHSPDLGKDMCWLEHGRNGMRDMLSMIAKHVRLKGVFKRHVNVYFVDPGTEDGTAFVQSSVLLIHTDLNGVSKLFAAARYEDTIDIRGEAPRLRKRLVRLDTRDLSPGIHVPI